jgi:hypothetical protein
MDKTATIKDQLSKISTNQMVLTIGSKEIISTLDMKY